MHILLTRRALALRKHSGEVSFPGGRRDPEDPDLRDTALREAWEEVGLLPEDVRLYGAFSRLPTGTGFHVTSFVGEFSDPYELRPNPAEIDYLITPALDALLTPEVHQLVMREIEGITYPAHTFNHGPQPIWGATAFMLHLFEALRRRQPQPVHSGRTA